jgi:hypothetical protein
MGREKKKTSEPADHHWHLPRFFSPAPHTQVGRVGKVLLPRGYFLEKEGGPMMPSHRGHAQMEGATQ